MGAGSDGFERRACALWRPIGQPRARYRGGRTVVRKSSRAKRNSVWRARFWKPEKRGARAGVENVLVFGKAAKARENAK